MKSRWARVEQEDHEIYRREYTLRDAKEFNSCEACREYLFNECQGHTVLQMQMKQELLAVLSQQYQHPLSNSKEDCAAGFNAYVDNEYNKKS